MLPGHAVTQLLPSEGTHAKYHYLICGVQGDFTRSLVNDPPTHLWTRQLKVCPLDFVCPDVFLTSAQFAGVSNTSTLYKRGIRVCTGTGLGAALSTCIQVRFPAPSRNVSGFSCACPPEPRLVRAAAPRVRRPLRANVICVRRYLIWIGSDQEKTFGPTIANLIHRHLGKERCCLWDSKARGASCLFCTCGGG